MATPTQMKSSKSEVPIFSPVTDFTKIDSTCVCKSILKKNQYGLASNWFHRKWIEFQSTRKALHRTPQLIFYSYTFFLENGSALLMSFVRIPKSTAVTDMLSLCLLPPPRSWCIEISTRLVFCHPSCWTGISGLIINIFFERATDRHIVFRNVWTNTVGPL